MLSEVEVSKGGTEAEYILTASASCLVRQVHYGRAQHDAFAKNDSIKKKNYIENSLFVSINEIRKSADTMIRV